MTLSNTFGSLALFYVFYDFFYTLFHRALHIRALYPLIHKHHHKQKVRPGCEWLWGPVGASSPENSRPSLSPATARGLPRRPALRADDFLERARC